MQIFSEVRTNVMDIVWCIVGFFLLVSSGGARSGVISRLAKDAIEEEMPAIQCAGRALAGNGNAENEDTKADSPEAADLEQNLKARGPYGQYGSRPGYAAGTRSPSAYNRPLGSSGASSPNLANWASGRASPSRNFDRSPSRSSSFGSRLDRSDSLGSGRSTPGYGSPGRASPGYGSPGRATPGGYGRAAGGSTDQDAGSGGGAYDSSSPSLDYGIKNFPDMVKYDGPVNGIIGKSRDGKTLYAVCDECKDKNWDKFKHINFGKPGDKGGWWENCNQPKKIQAP